jgi:hypothetical protein
MLGQLLGLTGRVVGGWHDPLQSNRLSTNP